MTLLCCPGEFDEVAYIPVIGNEQKDVKGIVRIISEAATLRALTSPYETINPNSYRIPTQLNDGDLGPHLIGRWAGSTFFKSEKNTGLWMLDPESRKTSLTRIMSCVESFLGKCHIMYWRRDFGSNEICFDCSSTPQTEVILRGLKDSLKDPKHLFSMVAKSGRAIVLNRLLEDIHHHFPDIQMWSPDNFFVELCDHIGEEEISYFGIPLKVDDTVIGVMTVLTAENNGGFAVIATVLLKSLLVGLFVFFAWGVRVPGV